MILREGRAGNWQRLPDGLKGSWTIPGGGHEQPAPNRRGRLLALLGALFCVWVIYTTAFLERAQDGLRLDLGIRTWWMWYLTAKRMGYNLPIFFSALVVQVSLILGMAIGAALILLHGFGLISTWRLVWLTAADVYLMNLLICLPGGTPWWQVLLFPTATGVFTYWSFVQVLRPFIWPGRLSETSIHRLPLRLAVCWDHTVVAGTCPA